MNVLLLETTTRMYEKRMKVIKPRPLGYCCNCTMLRSRM